jgi:predicted ribosomally synthesized peptide with SipW-like signal peptide
MGRKRIKQYLMLLLAIGVIAVAASGGGTFASFSAEVTNANNVFATGSLILNNTHGSTTCTSAINSGVSNNTNNLNSTGHDCATLFNVAPFSYAHAAMGAGTPAATSITLTSLTGGTIYRGDVLTITPNSGSSFTVTTTNTTPVSSPGAVTISAPLGATFSSATILDGSPTALADVTLQNAGTLAANDVVITPSGCTASYREGHGTLTTLAVAGNAVNGVPTTVVGGTWSAGDPVIVTDSTGTHSQTFIATGGITSGSIPVQTGQTWNYAYPATTSTVSGPQFNGNTANSICGQLLLSITENSTASFPTAFTNASSCVYGGNANPVNTSACDLTQGVALSSNTATALGGTLAAGASRYFQLAVHLNSSGFDNTYQNTAGTGFSLTWHVDQ